ncbi:MAG: two-component system sensor histidine kinase NtrB, partial [Thermodesulfobacteriota bacterium]
FNGEPRPSAYDGVMRDRTERRKLEHDLRASREALVEKIRIIDELYEHIVESGKCKAIEEHTAEVAHELRQPLAIIGGFARRIAKQLDTPGRLDRDRQRQYLEIIVTEIHRLEKILDRLIEFTKRNQVNLQPVNPNDLIEYIIEITTARMSDKRIKLVKNLGPEIGEIPLDPGRFQQLVLNLVSNAIDASPIGGTIEIETGASIPSAKAVRTGELESESFFEMKIRNSGPKISPEALQQIFNPFYSTKPHGSGIGLAVSKKIVEDHFGSISVRSDDEGTTFTVWLPVTAPDQRRYALLFRNADSIFGPESSPPSAQ